MINDIQLPFLSMDTVHSGQTTATINGVFARGGKFNKYTAPITLDDGRQVNLSCSDTSISYMVSAWGNDPSKWVGNKIKYELRKTERSPTGKMHIWHPILENSEKGWDEQ